MLGGIDKIPCPCKTCRNMNHQTFDVVYEHLVIKGMDPTYRFWYHHGEEVPVKCMFDGKPFCSTSFMSDEKVDEPCVNDDVNEKVVDANTFLYPHCTKYTRMSAVVSLYKIKATNDWTDKSFTSLLELLHDMLPPNNVIPKSTYEVKRFLKVFDLGYEKIHACENDCCLFTKENKDLETCPICGHSRWKVDKRTKRMKRGVPTKVLRYFPLIPRLKRMFQMHDVAELLTWHMNHKNSDGKMRHPVDSVSWDSIDAKWPDFSNDPRNLRFGLATDGFNPFSNLSSRYSCWPVMLVTYNLPPWLCMSKENIMLTLLIPGPKQPGNDIDIFLQPLIDDLKLLWDGVEVYDVVSKSNFNLRAVLIWTINDFPAYGNLAGCTTKGKTACPICGEHTHSQWLYHSKKLVYMGHRRFLPPSHPYRRKKSWFDGKVEDRQVPRIANGNAIDTQLKDFQNFFGKVDKKKRKRQKELKGMWKKRSIFFDLPYWKELVLRHNLDVMHVEKNVCESIIGTLLDINGKSKDGYNARKDLQDMNIRHDLHPVERESRVYLPPALHTLSKLEKQLFCKRLYELKVPDGYSSNISNCVSVEETKVMGLKSHDYHVLMQQLLPVVIRGMLPKGPRHSITRICGFFNKICQRVIDRESMLEIEKEVIETLCLFERYFPPSFFDIMTHLVIHLGREVRLCGPVQFRWMYPFERYMKTLKGFVRNQSRPEGCIAERYLAEECILFYKNCVQGSTRLDDKQRRNEEFNNDIILEGRPISTGKEITLSDEVLNLAHQYVLFNTKAVEPYIE
ncbi:hypothetical protein IC582_003268 [Cucumis melo]